MLSKKIKFICTKEFFDMDIEKPIPALNNVPSWYKNIKTSIHSITVKSCMPFLDSLTAGYIIKLPVDLKIKHNMLNPETGKRDGDQYSSAHKGGRLFEAYHINVNTKAESHPTHQVEGSPLLEKNKNLPIHKFMNPWLIKTPPGYSCLFVPPMNNTDDRFSIIPGIVDTDKFEHNINFPFIINGDKYEELDTLIEKGTAIAQVIPFKRDDWKMSVEYDTKEMFHKRTMKFFTRVWKFYKTENWVKKIWR